MMKKNIKKKYYKYELNMTIMNILSIVLFIVPFIILALFNYEFSFSFTSGFFYIGMFLYLIIHEVFHAIGFSIFAINKKNIKMGIALEKGVLYALCQEKISKTGIIVSLLFPLIFLSFVTFPISIIFNINWLLIYSIINFGGAIGDIMMTILILGMPKNIEYIDYNNDVGAYLISEEDLTNKKCFGFKLVKVDYEDTIKPDESIKRFEVSKTSAIVLLLVTIFSIFIEIAA